MQVALYSSRDGYRCYMDDLKEVSDAELSVLAGAVRRERLRRQGSWITCANCGERALARRGARFCSGRCRVAAFRARRARTDEEVR